MEQTVCSMIVGIPLGAHRVDEGLGPEKLSKVESSFDGHTMGSDYNKVKLELFLPQGKYNSRSSRQ